MEAINTTLAEFYKIGPGPSSSHTIGPMRAALQFLRELEKLPDSSLEKATGITVDLLGSLSATGVGHGTDRAVAASLLGNRPDTCDTGELARLLGDRDQVYHARVRNFSLPFTAADIRFGDPDSSKLSFANSMVTSLKEGDRTIFQKEYYSIGGGFITWEGEQIPERPAVPYPYRNMTELIDLINGENLDIKEIMMRNEAVLTGRTDREIERELDRILKAMEVAVKRGLEAEGVLPGPIGLARKAPGLYRKFKSMYHFPDRFLIYLSACSLAASEENASGNRVVTAPTSGSSGVIPGLLYTLRYLGHMPHVQIRDSLLAGAAIGYIIKHNASISGAEVGCQGEIGVAAAMAAGMAAYLNGGRIEVIANAAEIALEHHLGMTCDPIGGYVQIPCIERNGMGVVKAYAAYLLATGENPENQKVWLDSAVQAMLETGHDMSSKYRETAQGGLAEFPPVC